MLLNISLVATILRPGNTSQIRHISESLGFSSFALSYFSFCFEQKQYLKFNSFVTLKLFFLILQHYIFKKFSSINTSIVHVFSSFFFLKLFVAIWLFMKIVIILHEWWKVATFFSKLYGNFTKARSEKKTAIAKT